jgi:hypothetical protein
MASDDGFEIQCSACMSSMTPEECVLANYDDPDLSAADELDDRYSRRGRGPRVPHPAAGDHRRTRGTDWDAYEGLLHPEFAFVDHRRIGQGSGNHDELLTSTALTELASGFSYIEPRC